MSIQFLLLTFLPVELVLERQDLARDWYPPMTSISSTAGYRFFSRDPS